MEEKNDKKFNNIIYYDANVLNLNSINEDSDFFERETPGAFILCTNMNSFKLIREEILLEIEKDRRISFNLITTGNQCDNVMQFLDEDLKFKNCIKNVCIYCTDNQNWDKLKSKYDLVYDVVSSKKDVIDYIKHFSSEEIQPYRLTKIITLNDYLDKYKDRHKTISQYYGDLTCDTFKNNIEKMKTLIDQENKEHKLLFNNDQNKLLESFSVFDIGNDLNVLDKLIIREYTKNTFYADLNKWLKDTYSNFNFFEIASYFASRLMYSLNSYAKKEGKYFDLDKQDVHRGVRLAYSSILPYERAKGKIIVSSAFTSAHEDKKIAERFSGRANTEALYKTKNKFSVIFIIKNYYKKDWISNGIKVEDISQFRLEKEIIYLPFSFFYVKEVQIDTVRYMADIYLETIGKKEILEEEIKKGKEIEFNKKDGIMEVKQ